MSSPVAWNNLAIALKESGRIEPAKAAFRKALELDPTACHPAINLARLHLAVAERDAARKILVSAGESCPELEFLVELYLEQIDRFERS
jgi:Flp pilus assembly protein TadD